MRARGRGLRLAAALACLLLLSCATRPPREGEAEAELLGLLDPGALAYLRLSGAAGLGLAPALLPAAQSRGLSPLLERSESLALALLPGPGHKGAPAFEAALRGEYPRLAASLALGADRAWKRRGGLWRNEAAGIAAALPDGRHVLASNGELEALLPRLEAGHPSPLPTSLSALAEGDFLLWLPRPLGEEGILGAELDLPLAGLLISGRAAGSGQSGEGEAESFELAVAFLMEDAASARIYAPALRLAWYLLARRLFPGEEALLEARFERRDELFAAGGLRVRAAGLAAALSSLAGAR